MKACHAAKLSTPELIDLLGGESIQSLLGSLTKDAAPNESDVDAGVARTLQVELHFQESIVYSL